VEVLLDLGYVLRRLIDENGSTLRPSTRVTPVWLILWDLPIVTWWSNGPCDRDLIAGGTQATQGNSPRTAKKDDPLTTRKAQLRLAW
jgi:hypothetical protein